MDEPCITSYTYDLVFCGVLIGILGLCAIVYAGTIIRQSVLGRALVKACGNDWDTAAREVDRITRENALLEDAMAEGLRQNRAELDR